MRLLYLPNEPNQFIQYGPRQALKELLSTGLIDDLEIFSYQAINDRLGNWNSILNELYKIIEIKKPTSILVAHIGNYPFPYDFWQKIKQIYTNTNTQLPIIAYDERDVFGRFSKPLPKTVLDFCKKSDVIFLVAAGKFADRFRKNGCENVCYLPNVDDVGKFKTPEKNDQSKDYDIVMIANNVKSRIPFMAMPGSRKRELLAYELSNHFGERFALYGRGWEGNSSNKGPVEFHEQDKIMHKAWIRVNYFHFPKYEGYFSNSLSFTLISGTPAVIKYTPGMENLLVDGYHCRTFNTIYEAVNICKELLTGDRTKLIEMGLQGAELANEILTESFRMKMLVRKLKMHESSPFRKLCQ